MDGRGTAARRKIKLDIIGFLTLSGGLCLAELEEKLNVSRVTLSNILNELVDADFLIRDKRIYSLKRGTVIIILRVGTDGGQIVIFSFGGKCERISLKYSPALDAYGNYSRFAMMADKYADSRNNGENRIYRGIIFDIPDDRTYESYEKVQFPPSVCEKARRADLIAEFAKDTLKEKSVLFLDTVSGTSFMCMDGKRSECVVSKEITLKSVGNLLSLVKPSVIMADTDVDFGNGLKSMLKSMLKSKTPELRILDKGTLTPDEIKMMERMIYNDV